MLKKILFILFTFSLIVNAQFDEFHSEYNWFTIKGKHVSVHFHEGAERTAKTIAKIGDEVWGPITSLYGYEPESAHYVIKDIDDYSNGATYFFDNKIEIWASALDMDLRGSHNWLRNVISHEFTHLVQIQAAMKLSRSIPAVYLQFLNYEDKRRPDILYGFPNFIASYPVATINIPAWFAEGTAQYMRKEFNYDNWDSHRDMILRSYALDGKLLTWNQMGVFNKTSLGNESVYNSGFALTRYLAQKYGEEKIAEITRRLGKWSNFTIDAAFKDVLGKDGDEIYNEWTKFLIDDYNKRIENVRKNEVSGMQIVSTGFGNFYPQFSPDGKKFLYVSNKKNDYFSLSSIYLRNLSDSTDKMLVSMASSTVEFLGDKNQIIYAKLDYDNPGMAFIHDLFIYDIDKDKDTRLTFGLRANNPSISHDEKSIVFVYQKDGTTNLGSVDIEGKNFKRLTFFEKGEQVYNPKFSPDGKWIIFDYSYANSREIAKVNADGSGYEVLIENGTDNRNPVFKSSNEILYSSDETGIFNLYMYNLETKTKQRITNVIGGAFMPAIDKDGNILYAGYTSSGYKIFNLSVDSQSNVNNEAQYVQRNNPPLENDLPKGDITKEAFSKFKNYNDKDLPEYNIEKYTGVFSKLSVIPFIRYDNYNISNSALDRIKPGIFLASNDYLNRYSIFAGGSLNKRFERDLLLQFDYRNKLPILFNLGLRPTLTLELYSISRKTNTNLIFDSLDNSLNTSTDVTYNLFEVDLAAKNKFINDENFIELRFIFSRYSAEIGSFIFPNTSILYPTSNDVYLIGRNLRLTYNLEGIIPSVDSDINPIGRKVEFKYDYEFNRFNKDNNYEIVEGMLKPLYRNFNFHRVELNWKEHIQLMKDNVLTFQFRGASILGPAVPDFFDYYLGGLIGMKSYPFYAISGNELLWANLTYRFPLFKNIDKRLGHLYIDKVYFSVFGDLGNAWTGGGIPAIDNFKKGLGAEIRIKVNSFYLFPTSVFFSSAYSFDKITKTILGETINYGKEWSFYGGILFEFDF
ncbi:MAG: biopolymer transporter Tol [Melioribacteraceae bacterium]|nr:biopolymer transporter Tol [Melioribacteraceae bacterium]